MVIEVYADIVCPWCYVGARRLSAALGQRPRLPHPEGPRRRWRPFQLQPTMPRPGIPWADFVRQKFGGPERARAVFARVAEVGARDGIRFDFDRVASAPNTRDAHRLILYAAAQGREWELAEALFAAYFAEGCDLGRREELVSVASAAGFTPGEVRDYLAGDEGGAEVDASQEMAYRRGVTGVPFYVFDGRIALSGAQPVEVMLQALDLAYAAPTGSAMEAEYVS